MSSDYRKHFHTSRRACLGYIASAALAPWAFGTDCPCTEDDSAAPQPPATRPADVLRVCADPNNLPFSNRRHEGFEDKIAAMIAADLGISLQFDWLPQRLGFYRTALKTFDSNLVMAAPAGFGKALITDAYYKSTYVFVARPGSMPTDLNDKNLHSMKIGVQLTGSDTLATHALAAQNLIDNIHGFPVFDESEGRPAEKIVSAVAGGEIDVAIVWGPQAGLFVKKSKSPLEMKPVTPEQDGQGAAAMPFTFSICIAVRRSETKLREQLNSVIARRQNEINRVLDEFSVPRLPLDQPAGTSAKAS